MKQVIGCCFLRFLGVVLFGIGIGMRRKKQWDEADEALREELKQWEAYTHKNMAEFNSWSKSMLLITIIIMILLFVISEKIKKYL